MPEVTTVRVVRRRSVQPEQFGNAAAEVELVGNVLEGEDYKTVARQMLVDARQLVYENIGLKLPASAVEAAEEVDTPTETVKVEVSTEEKKTKGRGRPKGSKDTSPRKNAAKKQEEVSDDDIPGEDDDGPNIRNNPEDRRNPEDDDIPGDEDDLNLDVGDEDEEQEEEFTAEDLHKYVNDSVKAAKLTVAQAKQMQREMKVGRIRDLDTPAKVTKAKKMIDSFISENAAK